MKRTELEIRRLKIMLKKMNYCSFSIEEKKMFYDIIKEIEQYESKQV